MIKFSHLAKTKSTQDVVKRLLKEGSGDYAFYFVSTDNQYQGRGRSNKVWQHSPGNICASLGFKYTNLAMVPFLQHLTALSFLEIFENPNLAIKWPNDLYNVESSPKKIGGILVESENIGKDIGVVVGCGINTASTPNPDLFGTIGETSFTLFDKDNQKVLESFFEEFQTRISHDSIPGEFFDEYNQKLLWRGEKVLLQDTLGEERIEGRLLGLNHQGGVTMEDLTSGKKIEVNKIMSLSLTE